MLRYLQYEFRQEADIPKALARTLGFFGSLVATRHVWAELLRALGCKPRQTIYKGPVGDPGEVAQKIVREAVPVEGDPHPQRAAAYAEAGSNTAAFTTPGGVKVQLYALEDDEYALLMMVEFGRASRFAATCVTARLFETLGNPRDGIDLGMALSDAVSDRDWDAEDEAAMDVEPPGSTEHNGQD